jgi:betaine-aldehyde dehydrogenase
VLAVKTFKSEEEALLLANNSAFALGAAVLSKDEDRAARMVRV